MITASLFILLFIPFAIFIAIGIPIIIGVVVYRDANKRVDCSPWLWALVAALVPSYIGAVIYLIIRRDYPLKPEHQSYSESYQQQYYDEFGNPIKNPHRGFPTWAKVLLIIGVIVVSLTIISAIGAVIYGLFGFVSGPENFYCEF